jgi:hypothetical protein
VDIKVDRVKVGNYRTSCYIVAADDKIAVVDPGGEFRKLNI